MRKLKRVVAITLAATMVAGGSLMSFAAGETSGEAQGTGSSEGHVDKKVTNVVLPTVSTGSASPFAYTMDPERLVSGTDHAKYENAEFPDKSSDTGVYFNNGPKGGEGADKDNVVYANTSTAQKVINKSSHAIDLTVKAEAVTTDTDIPLVEKTAIATADAASLYLGLLVDTEAAAAVTKDTAATKTVSIDGTEDNFKIAAKADKSGYEYRELTLAEYQALDGNSGKNQADYDASWKFASFKLEGSTTTDKTISSATTAPTVKVTWSWVDPNANAAPSIATTTYAVTANTGFDVEVSLGSGDLAASTISSALLKGVSSLELLDGTGTFATYTNGKLSLTAALATFIVDNPTVTIDVCFDDGTVVTLDFTTN